MNDELTSLPAIQIANFAVNRTHIKNESRKILRDALGVMINDLCRDQLTEYHKRLKEVLETTGQLREEDLAYCLGLVSEDALDGISKQKELNNEN